MEGLAERERVGMMAEERKKRGMDGRHRLNQCAALTKSHLAGCELAQADKHRLMGPAAAAAAASNGHVMSRGWMRACIQRWGQTASAAQDGLPVQEPRSEDETLLQSTSGFSSCSRSQTGSLKDADVPIVAHVRALVGLKAASKEETQCR